MARVLEFYQGAITLTDYMNLDPDIHAALIRLMETRAQQRG